MNILYSWLNDFLDFNLTPEETAKTLTSIGLENGPVEEIETIRGGLEGLVIGEVLTCIQHPDSDHLHLTTVNIGLPEPLKIVCGAPNVAAGQKVIVATIGTKLYMGDECVTIKKSKIRGQESFGMICAEDEIGIGTSHDGIIELPETAKVGTLAKDYYDVKKEYVLEVDITPNRADAFSHYGVARDLAANLKQTNPGIQLKKPSVDTFQVDNQSYPVRVSVETPEACIRYSGVTVSGIHVGESPKWLQDRLRLIGLRPINNVVDVTNYILHETGHPMHAFDGSKITGDAIHVKTVEAGTKFTTLDGVERTLDAADLMICNDKEPMCMAGVFGGLDSSVTETTTKVFLESACFHPVWIRKTARRYGLNTDSSFRFERGVDPNNTLYILKHAALMIKELAGGTISSDIIDYYPVPVEGFKVSLSYDKVNRLIGKVIEPETVKSILRALEIKLTSEKDGILNLVVPPYRVDVQRDVDVIEDILRIYGYNKIEFNETIRSTISPTVKPDSHKLQNLVSEQLTAIGFNEILNNSLSSSAYYKDSKIMPAEACVKLMNPLSADLSVMRQSLLFGGLESIAHNRNRRKPDLKFYEFGNCYHYDASARNQEDVLAGFTEEMHLGIWMTGFKNEQNWTRTQEKVTVFDLKACIENILNRLVINRNQLQIAEGNDEIFSHSLSYSLKNGKQLIVLGELSNSLLKPFDIDTAVYYADIEWKALLHATKRVKVSFTEIPKFPEVRRDLALLIDSSVHFEEIQKIAFATERKLLQSVNLFDVYEGKNLPAGKKSYAVSFVLQDMTQTLTDKQIEATMSKLIKNYEQQLGATLR